MVRALAAFDTGSMDEEYEAMGRLRAALASRPGGDESHTAATDGEQAAQGVPAMAPAAASPQPFVAALSRLAEAKALLRRADDLDRDAAAFLAGEVK